jgi:uncharacterized membrane protein YjjB (DUF3815 family)
MVVISCISFAANKTANHFIFNRSDVVSAIGAFAVGLLGNVYSRRFGGTAFTAMVTGVLFLVPVRASFSFSLRSSRIIQFTCCSLGFPKLEGSPLPIAVST